MIAATDSLGVHISDPTSLPELDLLLTRLAGGIEISCGPELPANPSYEILIEGRPSEREVLASGRLRILIIPYAGVHPDTRRLMLQHERIAVHNLHYNGAATAEMAIGLLLAAAKDLVPCDRALRVGDWSPRYRPNPSALLEGKTALILGYGEIGRRVARACLGLGMHVIATRYRPGRGSQGLPVEIHPPEALTSLCPRSDALMICLPMTGSTEGLLGAGELALLPPKAILVNVARGPIVEESALFQALKDGNLGAAGIDAWYRYPEDEAAPTATFPSAYPFHELDNVVMSPHRGGGSRDSDEHRMQDLAGMLNAALRGESLPNRVDLQLGY